jgi:hypothetical protein
VSLAPTPVSHEYAGLPACSPYSRCPSPEYASLTTHTFPLFAWDVLSCRSNACICAHVIFFALCRDILSSLEHSEIIITTPCDPRTNYRSRARYHSFPPWVPIASFVLRQLHVSTVRGLLSSPTVEAFPTAFPSCDVRHRCCFVDPVSPFQHPSLRRRAVPLPHQPSARALFAVRIAAQAVVLPTPRFVSESYTRIGDSFALDSSRRNRDPRATDQHCSSNKFDVRLVDSVPSFLLPHLPGTFIDEPSTHSPRVQFSGSLGYTPSLCFVSGDPICKRVRSSFLDSTVTVTSVSASHFCPVRVLVSPTSCPL